MKTKKPIYSKKYFFPIFILIATLFMCVGYAAVNSVILSIGGTAVAETKTGVYITDAYIDRGVGTGVKENSKITQVYQTNFGSTVVLDSSNRYSYIYFVVSIYNSTDDDYQYVGPEYIEGETTYDNTGIVFTISDLTTGYILKSKESVTFSILFSYKNYVVSESNVLNSIINFKFESIAEDEEEDEEILTSAGVFNASTTDGAIFGSNLYKSSIESVSFVKHENVPSGATSWDASAEKNGPITGWYVDSNNDNLYEVYIGADSGRITFPANCSNMFYYWTSLKSLDFGNVDTSQVTNMNSMFYYNTGLKSLDLSNFDTSNVVNMGSMFSMLTNLTELDLRNFETDNVTNMSNMFNGSYRITLIRLDNATFDNVTGYVTNMFYSIKGTVVTKDETTKSWLETKALPYTDSVTVKTVAEYESQ